MSKLKALAKEAVSVVIMAAGAFTILACLALSLLLDRTVLLLAILLLIAYYLFWR